jgi:MYXO-CTERM domain-containing protein
MFSLVNIGAVDQWVWAPNLYSVAPSGAPDTIWMLTTGAGDTCPDPPFWLSPGTSCNLVVIFYPKDELLYQGSLRAFYNTEESPFSGNLAWAEVFGEGEADIPIINRADSGCGCSLSNSDGKVTLRPIALLALFVYGLCLWRRRRKT